MKNIRLSAIILVIVLALTSCGAEYVDTVSAKNLAEAGIAVVSTEGGTKILDDDVILEFCEEKPSYLIDYTVIKANNAKNINEIGVFRVEAGNADEFKELVEAYVENLVGTYRAMNYFPEEVEKIDCATCKIFGNYVIYSFLNEADTDAFYDAIENMIKK